MSAIAGLLRLASVLICLIVLASFAVFAVDQTKGASAHQQEEVNRGGAAANTTAGASGSHQSPAPHESGLREALDEASNNLTSPFSAVTSGSSSQWVIRGVGVLLTLIVYGFGLGFLARVLRVRL